MQISLRAAKRFQPTLSQILKRNFHTTPTKMSLLFPRISSMHPSHGLHIGPTRNEWGPLFSLFNDTMNEMQRNLATSETPVQSFTPRFDVKEEQDAYHLEGEMPGIAQKDIEIEFADEQTLTIKGRSERYVEQGEKPKQIESPIAAEKQDGEAKSTEAVTATQNGETSVAKTDGHSGPTYWMAERSIGEFKRSFNFPHRVDQDAVKASLKNGILSIVVPKEKKTKQSKKVTIEEAE
jgi:HSP20 family protein